VKDRIGLFGGTFDPIHCGHIRAAEEVLRAFALDGILFIPSFLPPHKERPGMAPARDRLNMVELACRGKERLAASSVEVDAGEKSYSIITVEKIKKRYPGSGVFFILGVDAFLEIETWREHERLLGECPFIVMARPGYDFEDARRVLGPETAALVRSIAEGGTLDEDLPGAHRVFFLTIRALDISSTAVRLRAGSGLSLEGLVPADVDAYIRAHHLYQRT
jgi:nicotinate-nucleotide adenylyltransferase